MLKKVHFRIALLFIFCFIIYLLLSNPFKTAVVERITHPSNIKISEESQDRTDAGTEVTPGIIEEITSDESSAIHGTNYRPKLPELNWPGKRSDWINIRTDVTTKGIGDGVSDDTAAIQEAFDLMSASDPYNSPKTVYFPEGTYRITKTLTLRSIEGGCRIIGHGRKTILKWDGEQGGTMILLDGVPRSIIEGIQLDGSNTAGIGLQHSSSKVFVTETDHRHLGFKNLETGIFFGNDIQASAEQSVRNCLFENCSEGIYIQRFNNYNILISGSNFYDCGIGIDIQKGANGYIRDCHFENSSITDIIGNRPEHPCSFIRCTSLNSNQFLDWAGGVSTAFIQNCHVSGWKNVNNAISLSGPPVVLFDCVFTNPPGTNPPVSSNSQLVPSNNSSKGTEGVYDSNRIPGFTEIPAGKLGGAVSAASQSFFIEKVDVPQKVFDVKNYGARGDGTTDDYVAIQEAINAARDYGQGAIAYLPRGIYRVNRTLTVTGSDYTIGGVVPGGSYIGTGIEWGGDFGGITMRITDPRNITIEQLAFSGEDNSLDILQTGNDGASSICYENVKVYGMYKKDTLKGMQLLNLAKGTSVILNHANGNIRVTDSSRANILINSYWEGTLTVEGASEKVRDGFLGLQARLATNVEYGLFVKDNQSIVATNFYTETADRYISVEGNGNNVEGYVTVAGIKLQTALNPQVNIDNYKGRIACIGLQHYQGPDPREIAQKGTQPVKMVFIGNHGYGTHIDFNTIQKENLILIQNSWNGPEDVIPEGGFLAASDVLDNFRRLGQIDLHLNYDIK